MSGILESSPSQVFTRDRLFCEQVLARLNSLAVTANRSRSSWIMGIHSGKTWATDENIVSLSVGSVATVRTIRRRPQQKRFDAMLMKKFDRGSRNMAGNASLCDDDDFSPMDPSTDVYEHVILRASHVKLVPSVYRSTVDIPSRKKQPRNLRQNL